MASHVCGPLQAMCVEHGKSCVNMLGVWNVINRGVQTSGEQNREKRRKENKGKGRE